jgi:hypothetical protein
MFFASAMTAMWVSTPQFLAQAFQPRQGKTM